MRLLVQFDLRGRDVLYVPGLKKNLVSVSALADKGYEVTFRQCRVFITPSNSMVAKQIGANSEFLIFFIYI